MVINWFFWSGVNLTCILIIWCDVHWTLCSCTNFLYSVIRVLVGRSSHLRICIIPLLCNRIEIWFRSIWLLDFSQLDFSLIQKWKMWMRTCNFSVSNTIWTLQIQWRNIHISGYHQFYIIGLQLHLFVKHILGA